MIYSFLKECVMVVKHEGHFCTRNNGALNYLGLLLSSPTPKSFPKSRDSRSATFFSGFPREVLPNSVPSSPQSTASAHPAQSCSTLVWAGSFIGRAVDCPSIWGHIWQAKATILRGQPCFSCAGVALEGWGLMTGCTWSKMECSAAVLSHQHWLFQSCLEPWWAKRCIGGTALRLLLWGSDTDSCSWACLPSAVGNSSAFSCSATLELTRVNSATAAKDLKKNVN